MATVTVIDRNSWRNVLLNNHCPCPSEIREHDLKQIKTVCSLSTELWDHMKMKNDTPLVDFDYPSWCLTSWVRSRNCFICDALRDLVPFVQFKKREKRPWRCVTFSKVAGWNLQVMLPYFTWARAMVIQKNVPSRMSVNDGDGCHSPLDAFLTILSFSEEQKNQFIEYLWT